MTKGIITNQEIRKKFPQIKYFVQWNTGDFNGKKTVVCATGANTSSKGKLPTSVKALPGDVISKESPASYMMNHLTRICSYLEYELKTNPENNCLVWRQLPDFYETKTPEGKAFYCYSRLLLTYLDIEML